MKKGQTHYGKGDANRSDFKKFVKNYDSINWSICLVDWARTHKISDSVPFANYLIDKYNFDPHVIGESSQYWFKLYKEFKNE
jgi:hypothetical protein